MSLATILLLALSGMQDPDALVEQLLNAPQANRDEIALRIRKCGVQALPALERAVRKEGVDSARLQRLIRVIKVTARLSPALLSALPGIEERLSDCPSDADIPWTGVFLEEVVPLLAQRQIQAEEVRTLAARAIEAASSAKEKKELCAAAVRARLVGNAGDLVGLLEDDRASVRQAAAEALGSLSALETIPTVLSRVVDPQDRVSPFVIAAMHSYPTDELRPLVIKGLQDPRPAARRVLVSLLGQLTPLRRGVFDGQDHAAVDALLRRLEDDDDEVGLTAVAAIRETGHPDAVARALPLLKLEKPRHRLNAALVVLQAPVRLRGTKFIVPRDARPGVREFTPGALKRPIPITEARMSAYRVLFALAADQDPAIKTAGEKAIQLQCLEGPGLADLRALLREGPADLRDGIYATLALLRLAQSQADLESFLRNPSDVERLRWEIERR